MTRTPIPARRPTSAKSTHRREPKTIPRVKLGLGALAHDSSTFFRPRESVERDHSDEENYPIQSPSPSPRRRRLSYSWDDESTLVSALLHDGLPDPKNDPSALADALEAPFKRAGAALVHDMAHALQPAVQRVSAAHRALTRRVDPAFATGLLAFDDACKGLEALVIDEQDALKTAFEGTETRIKALFARLEDAYAHRTRLWDELDQFIAQTVDPALQVLAEVPAGTERTIAALEKHAKTLAAKDDDGADKIRGMLAKFV
ncbi:hypothetical protein DFH07DRAFT_834135 [Mycena maculata]|uniref:Uncharacterized protein n=1 Tax=Mycena maculata TaxID=230809 RepID=A0AAD7IKN0_9AGAR|nr:hypothetical protein DFH07DRAFT_834135 [Mycena maculata]